MEENLFCGCCLTNNAILVQIGSCKHFQFYLKLYLNVQKVALGMTHICLNCHSIIKKLADFHDMAMETQKYLTNRAIGYGWKREKMCQLTLTEVRHFNVGDLQTESEPFIKEEAIEIKNENTWSDTFDSNTDVYTHSYNTDDLSNQFIEDKIEENINENIDDKSIPFSSNEKYSFDEFIDALKTDLTLTFNRVNVPRLSDFLKGKHFSLPKMEGTLIKCVAINLSEVLNELKEKRESEHFKQMQFRCMYCASGFKAMNIYETHMKRHVIQDDPSKIVVCDICMCIIKTHISRSHYAGHFIRYQCTLCNRKYTSQRAAKMHYKNTHDGSLRRCQLCDFSTNSNRALRYHREKKHSGVSHDCVVCGKALSNSSALKYHMATVHKTQPVKLVPCPECNKLFRTRSLKVHVSSVHGGAFKAFCETCRVHFKSERGLQAHLKFHRNHVDTASSVICDYCGKELRRKANLIAHILTVHAPTTAKKIKCTHCDKTFSTSFCAKVHEYRIHKMKRPERNHICDYCGKGFLQAATLKAHVRIHTGERPYKCNVCEATFTQSGPLYSHKRLVHLKIKRQK